jgi:hypothetical protein
MGWAESTTHLSRSSGIFEKPRYFLAKGKQPDKSAKRLGFQSKRITVCNLHIIAGFRIVDNRKESTKSGVVGNTYK